jgi:hypothetical protein
MAWEQRGQKTYYYKTVHCDGKVKRVYLGTGLAGRLAAEADVLRRAERKAEEEARRAQRDQMDAATTLNRDLNRGCELLAVAALLTAGFHRPNRHAWRSWRDGRRTLQHTA